MIYYARCPLCGTERKVQGYEPDLILCTIELCEGCANKYRVVFNPVKCLGCNQCVYINRQALAFR